jgi:hypothetical protein
MNIPMAYEVAPTGHTVAAVNHPPSNARAHGDHHSPLLLTDAEHAWSIEMASEGIAHLPVSWYRQTPHQAVFSSYGIASAIMGGLINFGTPRARAHTNADTQCTAESAQ